MPFLQRAVEGLEIEVVTPSGDKFTVFLIANRTGRNKSRTRLALGIDGPARVRVKKYGKAWPHDPANRPEAEPRPSPVAVASPSGTRRLGPPIRRRGEA